VRGGADWRGLSGVRSSFYVEFDVSWTDKDCAYIGVGLPALGADHGIARIAHGLPMSHCISQ
jgi:hypothetical protein